MTTTNSYPAGILDLAVLEHVQHSA